MIIAAVILAVGISIVGLYKPAKPYICAACRGVCDGVKLGIADARKHPQDGKTLEDLEDNGPEQLP